MSEKKPMPKCPYCGAEMSLEDNEDVLFGVFSDEEKMYWYQCNAPSCGIHSPANHTKAGAYKAAMKRYEEPNRVLTLDELQTYIGYAWYEGDHKWYHSSFDYPVWIENGKYNYEGDLYDIPDVEGRFWLRKPTEDEREAAKWLPEEKKNKKDGEDDE